jgi:hypothetical protein
MVVGKFETDKKLKVGKTWILIDLNENV